MKKSLSTSTTLILFTVSIHAQPFVDPLQLRYTHAFRNNNAAATPHSHLWAGSDLPVKLKAKTYLLLSPFYEQWQIDSAGKKNIVPTVQSLALPLGLIFPLNTKWSLALAGIVRTNGETLFGKKTFQPGGTGFASFAVRPDQKFRFGVYMNAECFGLFVMPLLGADWRIDKKNYLFGLLPGRLSFEHQWNRQLYGGFTFRAVSNSYRLDNGLYMRLEDNQLSAWLDFYPVKNWVLSLEPGFGLFRKIRTGLNDKNYLSVRNWGDGPFIRLSSSYRVRL